MRAELKDWHSPDIDFETFRPEDPDNFGFLLQVMIGAEGEKGADTFNVMVCTPEWLKANHSPSDLVWGRHMLIVFEYDLQRIRSHIVRRCERCIRDDWESIAAELSRWGHWEFEDYKSSF